MLELAIKAGLPLVAATTADTLNLPDVLRAISGRAPVKFLSDQKAVAPDTLYYKVSDKGVGPPDAAKVYVELVKAGSTLVYLNLKQVSDAFFQAGEVPTPRSLVLTLLTKATGDHALSQSLLGAFGGCTVKDVGELARLTLARDGTITPQGVMLTRKTCAPKTRGIEQVDLADFAYCPPPGLDDYLEREKPFFLTGEDPLLIPRGLLLDGNPGVGKSACAKHIAVRWGVPLYRVDLGTVQAKYVGESEANLAIALSQLDNEAPAVVLLDEVEKMVSGVGADTTGVAGRMLGQLLWWLQEHRSRVFVVMTSNNSKILPPELYRPGRIDRQILLRGLVSRADAVAFGLWYGKRFGAHAPSEPELHKALVDLHLPIPQADVVGRVIGLAKDKMVKLK